MTDQSTSHRGSGLIIIAASFVIIIRGINQARSVTDKGEIYEEKRGCVDRP